MLIDRRRSARWKSPALKKYGEIRPDFRVKVPNFSALAATQSCRKAALCGDNVDIVVTRKTLELDLSSFEQSQLRYRADCKSKNNWCLRNQGEADQGARTASHNRHLFANKNNQKNCPLLHKLKLEYFPSRFWASLFPLFPLKLIDCGYNLAEAVFTATSNPSTYEAIPSLSLWRQHPFFNDEAGCQEAALRAVCIVAP